MNALAKPDTAPHSLDAERAVLAALLMRQDAWHEVRDAVTAEEFYRDAHQVLYRRIGELVEAGRAVDLVTLTDLLRKHKELDEVGGPAYLTRLVDVPSRTAHAAHYAEVVREYASRRQAIALGKQLALEAYGADDIGEVLTKAERGIREISTGRSLEVATSAQAVEEAFEILEQAERAEYGITGIRTGFFSLDRMLGGLQRTDLIVVAARPSVGKTALFGQAFANAAIDDRVPTVIFTLEQPKAQLVLRMASCRARVDLIAVREKRVTDEELARLNDQLRAVNDAPITFVDRRDIRMSDVRRIARRLHAQGKCELLGIDYLTLMLAERSQSREVRRDQEVAQQSRLAKTIAKELDIPVVVLAQLSREYEKDGAQKPGSKPKTARRPRLSDLRESGAIEQDADVVLFVHRPFVRPTTQEERFNEGQTELLVAKQRNGPIGHIRAHYTKEWVRFEEREGE